VAGVRRVIVGASATPGSIPALRYAEALARREGALLIVVHAWVPPGGDLADRRAPSAYLRQMWAQEAGRRLAEAIDAAWGGIPGSVEFHALVVRGEPGPALVNAADATDDLLVVGAGRRGWLARIGHGRVARHCLARAHCPVLVVPPPDLARVAGRRRSMRRDDLTVGRALSELDAHRPSRNS